MKKSTALEDMIKLYSILLFRETKVFFRILDRPFL